MKRKTNKQIRYELDEKFDNIQALLIELKDRKKLDQTEYEEVIDRLDKAYIYLDMFYEDVL